MDIVEFAEKMMGRKLSLYESTMIKTFSKIPKDCQIVMGQKGPILVKSNK